MGLRIFPGKVERLFTMKAESFAFGWGGLEGWGITNVISSRLVSTVAVSRHGQTS